MEEKGPVEENHLDYEDTFNYEDTTVISTGNVTTVSSDPETDEVIVPLLILIFFLIIPGTIAGTVWVRHMLRKRKAKLEKKARIGLPISTLGTEYEINSLLSIENVGRKYSEKSDVSNVSDPDKVEELEQCLTKDEAYGEKVRVSKYIDTVSEWSLRDTQDNPNPAELSVSRSEKWKDSKSQEELRIDDGINMDEIDGYMNTTTLDTRLGMSMQYLEAMAPMAGVESNPASRPQSYYATIPEDRELVVEKDPPVNGLVGEVDPEVRKGEKDKGRGRREEKRWETYRPYSQIIGRTHSPPDHQNNSLHGAQSEMFLSNGLLLPSSPKTAKSESFLSSNLPPLPPKIVPLLPPKQAINKSREDVERINKDIMRSSMDLMGKKFDEMDQDYDLPVGKEDEAHDQGEDYDDPPLSHIQQLSSDDREDYDEPSHSFNNSRTTLNSSRYYNTPRKEYDEDFEDEQTFQTPNNANTVHAVPAVYIGEENGNFLSNEDYDKPQMYQRK